MLQAFYISLHEYDLIRPPTFIGFRNFIDLVQDPLFLQSARVSVIYVVFSCVPVWVLSLALAVLFNREIRAKNFFRSAAFMPVVMPAVVNAVVWTFMYHQDGVVNTILAWFSIDPIPWLRSSKWALWAVILIGIWRATPYYMVIFLAGLQAIPQRYYEAAQIDGAGSWSQFRHITLPLLKPTTLLVMVMSVIVAMKVFAVPLIMTGGGPAGRDTGAAALHLPDRLRVLQDGARGGDERLSFCSRDDLYDLPDPAIFARGGSMMRGPSRYRQMFVTYPLLVLISFIGLLPFYWMLSCSLKTNENMFLMPLQWFPNPINWNAYGDAWKAQDFTRYFLNTTFIAVAITVGNLLLASLAGYSLSKFRYFGRGVLFLLILSTMMLPLEVTMVPLFLIVKSSTGPTPIRADRALPRGRLRRLPDASVFAEHSERAD